MGAATWGQLHGLLHSSSHASERYTKADLVVHEGGGAVQGCPRACRMHSTFMCMCSFIHYEVLARIITNVPSASVLYHIHKSFIHPSIHERCTYHARVSDDTVTRFVPFGLRQSPAGDWRLQVLFGHLLDPEGQELERGSTYLRLKPGENIVCC